MLILGIESSCDDTAAAVVEDGSVIRSNVVASQVEVHARFGGVVPEIAARHHTEAITWVILEALREADVSMGELDAVAVTARHGLSGSLVVGVAAAKALAYRLGIPLLGVNHIEAHLISPFLARPDLPLPHLCLTVSGGHTLLVEVNGPLEHETLGRTLDDAAGEAFDKVARHLGLGFPGGPAIQRLAQEGDPGSVRLPRPMSRKPGYDFSFSGLKTAVLTALAVPEPPEPADLAASFQEAVVDSLWGRSEKALRERDRRVLTLAGGVAVNRRLREAFTERCEGAGIELVLAPAELCGDNGAMVAALAHYRLARGERSGLDLDVRAHVLLEGS